MHNVDRKVFFDGLRHMVRGRTLNQGQVDKAGLLLDNLAVQPGVTRPQAAYIMASAFHETDQFQTLVEYADGSAYEGRRDLGNVHPGDGRKFKGRGYVQITGRRNYELMAAILGEPLDLDPTLAAKPENAAEIAILGMIDGHFTGKSLPDFINDKGTDFIGARAVVNGSDRAMLIAGYASSFLALLEKAGFPEITEPDDWIAGPGPAVCEEQISIEKSAGQLSFTSALGCGSSIGILCTAIAASGLLPETLMEPTVITAASTLLTALATALGLCRHVNPAAATFLMRR